MVHKHRLKKSLKHAFRGVGIAFRTEQSFRIQLIAGVFVIILMLVLRVSLSHAILLLLLIGAVLVLELINSIFERLVDVFKPRIHPIVGEIKDIMAGAVLVASVASAIIGALIIIPYLV